MTTFKVEFIRVWNPAGLVGAILLAVPDEQTALNAAWRRWNRVDGTEAPFEGPSASVGDLFRVSNENAGVSVWRIQPVGFSRIDPRAMIRGQVAAEVR